MTWYALGEPGASVRQFVFEQTEEGARKQCHSQEIVIAVQSVPSGNCSISVDGTTVDVEAENPNEAVAVAWVSVRAQRDARLDFNRWAWMPDSPLTDECKAAWLVWAQAMHRVTVDFSTPAAVVWPTEPTNVYP